MVGPLRCAASAVLSSALELAVPNCGAYKALLLSDPRTLLLLIPHKESETVGSACRTTVIPVALEKYSLWLRIDVCVDIIAFDQHAVCRYVVSRSFAFTPIAEVQSCAGATCCSKANGPM